MTRWSVYTGHRYVFPREGFVTTPGARRAILGRPSERVAQASAGDMITKGDSHDVPQRQGALRRT